MRISLIHIDRENHGSNQGFGMHKCGTCWKMGINEHASFAITFVGGEMRDVCFEHAQHHAICDGIKDVSELDTYFIDIDFCPAGMNEAYCDEFCQHTDMNEFTNSPLYPINVIRDLAGIVIKPINDNG